jgi:hypothetical protein
MRIVKAVATAAILVAAGCAHTEEEKLMRSYNRQASGRLDTMDENIARLEARQAQLLGQPKARLGSAITELKKETAAAKAEVLELKARSVGTWTEKKPTVDTQLGAMDQAYDRALSVLSAH